MRLPKKVFLKRRMQNSCTKAARRHRRNYWKNLGKAMVFEDFHLSEGLRRGRNGSRFGKQNSFQNPSKIDTKSFKYRSWRPKAIKHRSWKAKKTVSEPKIMILEPKMPILRAKNRFWRPRRRRINSEWTFELRLDALGLDLAASGLDSGGFGRSKM